jgi:hypothetical protein
MHFEHRAPVENACGRDIAPSPDVQQMGGDIYLITTSALAEKA